MDSGDYKVLMYIVVGLIWAANALWQRHQEKQAQQKLGRQPQPPPRPAGAPPDRTIITAEGKRYQEVQEEIRRKIAERWQTPATGSSVPSAPPRYVTSRPPVPVARPVAPVPASVAVPTADMRASTAAFSVTMPTAPQTSASAYALIGPSVDPGTALRATLANPLAVQQAFLLREILDRPLCQRPSGCGGHEAWV